MLPWRCPDAAKQGRAVLAGPRESESALSVVGVACLRTPDPMTTRCSPAHCLGWVIRSDTSKHPQAFALSRPVQEGVELRAQGFAYRGWNRCQVLREFEERVAQAEAETCPWKQGLHTLRG